MIEPMKKAFVATSSADEQKLLTALRAAGVVHLRPSRGKEGTWSHTDIDRALSRARKAHRILERYGAHQSATHGPFEPNLVDEVIALEQQLEDAFAEIAAARAQLEQMGPWALFDDDFLGALAERGRRLSIFQVPKKRPFDLDAELVFEIDPGAASFRRFVVVSSADARLKAPPTARALPPPHQSNTKVARALHEQTLAAQTIREELEKLSSIQNELAQHIERLEDEQELSQAQKEATRYERMSAYDGWIPASEVEHLEAFLQATRIDFAVNLQDPAPEDDPPTLVEYRRATRPMSAIFDVLGVLPGYRERDVSGPFLVALPVFAAMLIADGGYGLAFLLAGALGYRLISRRMGDATAQLLVIIGACSVVWGFAIASFFGVGPGELKASGSGLWEKVGAILTSLRLVGGDLNQHDVVSQIMRISFVIGAVHMSLAELWRARLFFPDTEALTHVGWAVFLWGMLLTVQTLVLEDPAHPAMLPLLATGGITVVLFTHPHKNPVLRVLLGLAAFPLAALGTLSDTISYVRLMAVGLASTILAATFNELAAHAAESATWLAGGLILLVGHGLNIGLAVIALFAHGVRLNMLEFSGHLGMSWSGYPYAPLAPRRHAQR